MDLNNLTIPPELFYSKSPSGTWKTSKSLVKITPVQIARQIAKKLKQTQAKQKVSLKVFHKRKKYKLSNVPELGRSGKIKRSLIKKKFLKKKTTTVLQEKTGNILSHENNQFNNNVPVKPITKKDQEKILKEIKLKENSIQQRLFNNENHQRKRIKGSSFKFFKSKNIRESEGEESDENDELVPEIHDFADNTLKLPQDNTKYYMPEVTSIAMIIDDPAPFDDEAEFELEKTTMVIECLLKELEADDKNAPVNEPATSAVSLESLIATLEGSPTKGSSQKKIQEDKTVSDQVKRKTKLKGFGESQLQIDAGQKKFGFVECKECGFSYNTNVPEDEKIHDKHHQAVTSIPRFRGWQNEDAITINDWQQENGRIIHLHPNHKNKNSEFVKEIVSQMETEFGVHDDIKEFHVYLAVYNAKIVGIATIRDSVNAKLGDEEKCVRLGVQRLYIRPVFRRKGFAKALLKSIVILHNKGELLNLSQDVAFSSPTEEGIKLIENVVGSNKIFVFTS